ncbi:MAG TPA: acyltransferase family protein [Anaerolineae bacterium]|nr:acyltransferase family protein [Anaerolineae bacterium]
MVTHSVQSQVVTTRAGNAVGQAARLHYVDWLRLIATLGVFTFHVMCVFSDTDFHIKNDVQSATITGLMGLFFPWGMPLFFLLAGAGSWFALRRRTPRQYARERLGRLLIPFVVGSLVLTPVQLYLEWSHKVATGIFAGSFPEFLRTLPWGFTPRFFGAAGYHLWFLGFLFCYSILTLPLFRWLKGSTGQAWLSRLARICERRGGILIFVLPLLVVRLLLHAFWPWEHSWADFFFLLCFFILGFVVYADDRFTAAIWRDWRILLTVAVAAFLGFGGVVLATMELDVEAPTRTLPVILMWTFATICGWCFTAVMLRVGKRFLNRSNRWLRYGNQALLPFFVLHQPVIIVVAYFLVQWHAPFLVKLAAVWGAAFALSLGLFQLVIRRAGVLRTMFGVKAEATPLSIQPQEPAPASTTGTVASI